MCRRKLLGASLALAVGLLAWPSAGEQRAAPQPQLAGLVQRAIQQAAANGSAPGQAPANGAAAAGQLLQALGKAEALLRAQQQAAQPAPGYAPALGAPEPAGGAANQGELLHQEILRRAGHLQQVVSGSLEVLKTSSDLIMRRLLEQMGHRLEQVKARADKITGEQVGRAQAGDSQALRALATINQGLNNLQNIIANIVSRLEPVARAQLASGAPLDPVKLRQNLHQLHQQVQAAIQQQQQQQQRAAGLTQVQVQVQQPQPQPQPQPQQRPS